MRRVLLYLMLPLLVACGAPPAPAPAPVPPTPEVPVLLTIQALLQNPGQWSGRPVTLVAAVADTQPRLLVQGADPAGQIIADEPAGALWLAEPLPAKTSRLLSKGMSYLKLRGRVSPPGGYGTDGRYLYQFSAESASIIAPERTTLANVADNLRSLEGALLELAGILLIGGDGTLMVETVSSGGVPPANARQVKLRGLAPAQIPPGLQRRGAVRFGQVTITGWLQNGVLTPFVVR